MENLITVNYDNDRPLVSARELHTLLGVEKRFSAWFETNSKGFIENEDYQGAYLKVRGNQYGGEQVIQDYQMTLDMAKHLCLMSRTNKGKEIRQYCIEIEKDWNNPHKVMARALIMAEKEIKKLQIKVEEDKPKVLFADAVTASKSSILVGELAKILKQNGIDIGQNRLFKWLRNNGYLIKRKGTDYNSPTQRAMELGLFQVKETVITHSDGHTSINKTTKVTGKGQQYFINKLMEVA